MWYLDRTMRKGGIAMRLQESGEMYLEAIFVLARERGRVRSIDVSEYLGYSKPSVSRAVGLLKNGEYLTVDPDGSLILTDSGREIAEKIYERHTFLTDLLTRMGVSREIAAEDACRLEHAISDESFRAIKEYVSKNVQ
jgi:Mn-dependent DtxR family transcriptional regulator